MTLEKLLEGYKDGTISIEQAGKWHNTIITKRLERAEKQSKVKDSEKNKELEELQDKIEKLEQESSELKAGSVSQSVVDELINNLKSEYETRLSGLTDENERTKTLLAEKENAYKLKTLKEHGTRIAKKLGIANPEYAVDDLIRDGVLSMNQVEVDGKLDYEISTNFEYDDDVLKKRVKSAYKGNESNLTEIEEAFTTLATKQTSYNRFKELYPISKEINGGSGIKGNSAIEKKQSREEKIGKLFK